MYPDSLLPDSPSAPVGIFDSGVGGLSVLREVRRQLPHEALVFLADQAHVPYGPRPLAEVREFSTAITRCLLSQGAKLVVVACNTASAAALHHLRQAFPGHPLCGHGAGSKACRRDDSQRDGGCAGYPGDLPGRTVRLGAGALCPRGTCSAGYLPGVGGADRGWGI